MNKMVFKIAKKGEGKTRWLLNVANNARHAGHNVFLYTDDGAEYAEFCEKYLNLFSEVCTVKHLTNIRSVTEKDIVLVDDLFSYDVSLSDFTCMENNCYKMFITISGDHEQEFNNNIDKYIQFNTEI